jgi:tetratricopeptide (TPR) repeat protein
MKYLNTLLLLLFVIFTSCKNNQSQDAVTLGKMGKTGNRKIDSLTELIFKNPNSAPLYFERAKLFYVDTTGGGYDFAVTDMQYALQKDSNNIQYFQFLADVFVKYGQSRRALMTMEKSALIDPKNIPNLLKLAKIQLIVRQYPASMTTITSILKQDPQNSEAYFMLGMNYKETNDIPRALKAFQRAADLNSDNVDAFIELGIINSNKNNPDAIKYFNSALTIDSNNTYALLSKGVYLQTNNKNEDAINIYHKLLALDKQNPDAHFNLGLLYMSAEATTALALEQFSAIINERPTYYKAYYFRGQILEKQGKTKEAYEDYKQALAFSPSYKDAQVAAERVKGK